MKQKSLPAILVTLAIIFSIQGFSQEVAEVRFTKYTFDLNAIKDQSQVDAVTFHVKELNHVESCELVWLDYQMKVVVKEGGDYGSFSMERLKAILIEQKVELKNFTKEIVTK